MAKKKSDTAVLDIDDHILKAYGDVLVNADIIRNDTRNIIPVTPKLDIALGGGLQEGTMTILSGKAKHGKTCLALQIAKNALDIDTEDGPRECYYLSVENRFKARDLQIKGLDTNRIKIIKSTENKILMGTDFLEIAEKILSSKKGVVIIIDSFSALCSKERMEADLEDRLRDPMSLILSSWCRRVAPALNINKCLVIGILHVYANTSGQGKKLYIESGGNKIQYGLDQKIVGAYTQDWLTSDGTKQGLKVHWKVETTSLAGGTGGDIETSLLFGTGYSVEQDYIDLACDAGIIDKSGAWLTYKEHKMQGNDRMRVLLESQPTVFDELKVEVDNLFKK